VGSDYIFPRIANHLIRDLSSLLGATVIAEHYQPLGGEDFSAIAKEIAALRPAVVFNTLNGDSNIAFFAALRQQGVSAEEVPVLSFSITETELHVMTGVLPTGTMTGHYASWSYFETVASEENQSFVKRFRKRYGAARHLNDPMVSAYLGVKLWAQAVEEAKSFDPVKVRSSFSRQSMSGPGGIIYIDDRNHHAWKPNRIGRINDKGQFEIVWESRKPIRPESYPAYAERSNWQDLEGLFYGRWQEHWAKDSEVKP
ncbi:MAG: transporter substrate-binding protein, partial [Desulfobulbaceae bacterium]|nr:transporter substrate-binding protein [Desulfobulbaceae bacterium]